jgi:hypothetical protein
VVGAAALLGAATVARRLGRPRTGREVHPEPAPAEGPADPDIDLHGGEGAVHLMLEDGTIVDASDELDPDGRFRYLADNLLSDPDGR